MHPVANLSAPSPSRLLVLVPDTSPFTHIGAPTKYTWHITIVYTEK